MVRIMKKTLCLIPMLLILASCQDRTLMQEVSCRVKLDPANTYLAGDPVRFLIDGNADNILFYSGEDGSQYQFRDRFSVPLEQVKSVTLAMDYQARYGVPGGLDVYVSHDFQGLKGDDGEADRATVAAMYEGGMQGWQKLEYKEGASTVWTYQNYDITPYKDNLTVAFHWHPVNNGVSAQRAYWLNGTFQVEIEGVGVSSFTMPDLNPVVVAMNPEVPPYNMNTDASVRFNSSSAQIVCDGVAKGALDYALDSWVFTTPSTLNHVSNDKGVVVKNIQNELESYDYTYESPGNYKASFVCINASMLGSSRKVVEVPISIIDKF